MAQFKYVIAKFVGASMFQFKKNFKGLFDGSQISNLIKIKNFTTIYRESKRNLILFKLRISAANYNYINKILKHMFNFNWLIGYNLASKQGKIGLFSSRDIELIYKAVNNIRIINYGNDNY
ncbi:hypothetical protein BpHYR1_042048 [Brachionus plicatilis]|uniref:Uncharacterized protein n=1 Tax=Brachionus plicatilis TaxID=10195 RepID=A0A3M7R0Y0_BRAPC|nr:hypothetical protein BpHYR1_042048 [Brachionus plicatilis]